jgi:hypothetical protein
MRRTILAAVVACLTCTLGYALGVSGRSPPEVVVKEVKVPVVERVEVAAASPECPVATATPEQTQSAPAATERTEPARVEPVRVAMQRRAARGVAPAEAEAPARSDDSSFRRMRRNVKTSNAADRLVRQAISDAEQGKEKLAMVRLERALKKNPKHPVAHLLRGVLAQLDGNTTLARTEYERYLAVEPDGEFSAEVRATIEAGLKGPADKIASR